MPQDFQKSKPRKNSEEDKIDQEATDNRPEFRDRTLSDNSDIVAGRATQAHDYKGEAQNVNDDTGRPLEEEELEHARNKATEGTRQSGAGTGS